MNTAAKDLQVVTTEGDILMSLDSLQGLWTEEQYLRLTSSNVLLEFTRGRIDVLPMPTDRHQHISANLLMALHPFVAEVGGTVLFGPLCLRIAPGQYREPDLLLLLDVNDPRLQNAYWLGADLVVEIVSPDNPERDTQVKRAEYEQAGIPEYWIVNPEDETVTVLRLAGEQCREHGVFRRGDAATSVLLQRLGVEVGGVFDAR